MTQPRTTMLSHWRTEIECHAAFQEGGAEMKWDKKGITDQDALWIASALANPAVRRSVPDSHPCQVDGQ